MSLDNDATNACTIYETRPLLCRLFNCEREGREQLIELGILKRDEAIDAEVDSRPRTDEESPPERR